MIAVLKKKVKNSPKKIYRGYLKLVAPRHPKIFCIGRNKTGTTSFKVAMEELGFLVGNQRKAERLAPFYHARNFEPIIEYCQSAQVFQDVPFSWPETYLHLYKAFPDALFILTVRNSAEEWYDSNIRFKIKRFGKLPDLEDLKESNYVWKGWEYENVLAKRGVDLDNSTLWDRDYYISEYNLYNLQVREFFKDKQNQFLELNVGTQGAYQTLCNFLNRTPKRDSFPWENKTG